MHKRVAFSLLSSERRKEIMDEFVRARKPPKPKRVADYVEDALEEGGGGKLSDLGLLVAGIALWILYFIWAMEWVGSVIGTQEVGADWDGFWIMGGALVIFLVVGFVTFLLAILSIGSVVVGFILLFKSPFIIIDRIAYAVKRSRLMKDGKKEFRLFWNPKAARRLLRAP